MEGVTMPLQKSPQASDQISLHLRSVFEGGGFLKSQDVYRTMGASPLSTGTDISNGLMQSSNLNPPFDPAVKDTTVSSAADPLPQSASLLYDSGSSDSLIGNLSDNSFPQSRAASIGSDSTVPDSGQTYNTTLENPINFPDGFMKSILDYGAKPDDGIDDTAAIQKALDDGRRDANGNPLFSVPDQYNGLPKALYLPAGTYDVSDTIDWVGCNVTLQGQGSGKTVIRLKDNAAGFSNPAAPKAVIQTQDGNMAFRQNIWNLSVNTGNNNSAAIGIDYVSNNVGSMKDVTIKSEDGKGFVGLGMDRNWPGPCLIKNVQIDGFDYGIRVTPTEYGPTFENITLNNQRVAAINNVDGALTIRGLHSNNSVPVIKQNSWAGMVTLLDANLQGGAANVSAIETEGQLYARNITTSGYQSAIKLQGVVVPGATQTEYASNTSELFDSPNKSLNLPIKETPEYQDNNMDNWGRFDAGAYGDTSRLQSVLNSGKSTIYFPFDHSAYENGAILEKNGVYFSYNETVVTVPASVKRIIGFSSVVNGAGEGINGGGIKFVVEGDSSDPLIIEQFGYGVKVEQKSSRPVALKHGNYQYTSSPGAGDLFLEDVNIEPLYVQPNQNVWARQLNDEYDGGTKITNNGGNIWILGLKTEHDGTVLETRNGGKSELLGGVINPAHKFSAQEKQQPAFINKDSSTSLVYRHINYDPDYTYDILIEETRKGEKRQFLATQLPLLVPLFTGYS
ncbi:MAG: glycoside hydrolase family 55 protein [Scytonema hyalinum WJT4-NPBG1]|nr:glycoside hydrolase family 55 protein [Scytonema hyalinum WJT4-NPBG1]